MFTYGVSKATPHNAIKEKNGEQPTCKQLEALLNLLLKLDSLVYPPECSFKPSKNLSLGTA